MQKQSLLYQKRLPFLSFFLILLLVACSSSEPVTDTSSSVSDQTAVGPAAGYTPKPTATPQPTNTPEPTATPLPTHTPIPTGEACLVGTWAVTDMSDYMISLLPPDSGVEYIGQEGSANYTFTPDNQVVFNASSFVNQFKMDLGGTATDLNVRMNGQGNATYSTTGNQIQFASGDGTNLTFSADMGETQLFNNEVTDLGELFATDDTDDPQPFTYDCQANTLLLTPPVENAAPIVLERQNP